MKNFKAINLFSLMSIWLGLCSFTAANANTIPSSNASNGTSVEHFLASDGRISVPANFSGNLDLTGFSVSLDECAGPVAVPLSDTWNALGSGVSRGNTLVVDGMGNVYVGGKFTEAGGVPANNIAKWDGENWSALGSGLTRNSPYAPDPTCYDMVIDGAGDLYVAGQFNIAGGINVNNIARWDGSSWSPVGNGFSDACLTLAIDGTGNIYAGGKFTRGDHHQTILNYVAKWDGVSWIALGDGLNKRCEALAIDGMGHVYACGRFTQAGGVAANNIAKWDGNSWSSLGDGIPGDCSTLAIDGMGNVYVGGSFYVTTDDGGAQNVAKWDGNSWSSLGQGLSSLCFTLTVDGIGNVYAGGSFPNAGGVAANGIAKWDGTTWSTYGTGLGGNYTYCSDIAFSGAGGFYITGSFPSVDGVPANGIASYGPTIPTCDIMVADITATPETCMGDNDATLTITADCTTCTGMLYSIDGGTTFEDNGGNFTGLAPGIYMPVVRDSGGEACEATASDEVIAMGQANPSITCPSPEAFCVGAPTLDLSSLSYMESPAGGSFLFSGDGVSGVTFDPGAASMGINTIKVIYTAPSGCTTSCKFDLTVYEQPTVSISAAPDGDLCLGQRDVLYDATITSTDGGTYTYAWCAYNSGDGSGSCFGGFDDNTIQTPKRNWTSSAGTKSVGVTVSSDVNGCMATELYTFDIIAPTTLSCPADQTVTLVTNSGNFDCLAEATFNHPAIAPGPCDPVNLTISVDNNTPETVTPGASYTTTFQELGIFEVTYNSIDAVGNESTCSFNITVDGLPCGIADNEGLGCGGSNGTFDQNTETFSLTAGDECAPNTMLYLADASAFVFTELCGDGEISALVSTIEGTGFAGLMLRDSDSPSAAKIALGTNTVNRLRKEVRVIEGYPSSSGPILSFNQFWIRIVRSGTSFTAFASTDGVSWQPYVSQTIIMGECVLAGLYTYSEKAGNAVTATFENYTMTGMENLGQANLGAPPITIGAIGVQGFGEGSSAEVVEGSSLVAYPNPTTSELNLQLPNNTLEEEVEIRLYNTMGQLMMRQEVEEVQLTRQRLDVSHLQPGIYHVVVKVGDATLTERVVITR